VTSFPPGLVLVGSALVLLVLPSRLRPWAFISAMAAVFAYLFWVLEPGDSLNGTFLGMTLMPVRIDELSLIFGYVFSLIGLLGGIYAFHMRERGQQVAALLYAGGALGVVFAGDLLTLIAFWESMAFASAYLIWARRTPESSAAGNRYLFVHVAGGSVLLAGILWHVGDTGSLLFERFDGGPAVWLILFGFAVNAAIPPLHAWLADAYPHGTVTGSLFLSALTTKTAVYVLARGFPGWELLIWVGVIMALYGVVFAVLENDIRRLLAYHIISQVGYMVAAVGIGTETAINGAAAHAFAHVLYKGLLFMGAGTVLYATGRSKLTELGGLASSMRVVFVLYMIGALSISAFPLFSGFISKSIIIFAAEEKHLEWVVLLLYVASVGTFLHTGLKLPYFTWLNRRDERPVVPLERRVPTGMILAMVLTAGLNVALGIYPDPLYDRLPFALHYEPYTASHVVLSLQLLVFTGFGFWLLIRQLGGEQTLTLDTDWFYRKARRPAELLVLNPLIAFFATAQRTANNLSVLAGRFATDPEATWARLWRRHELTAGPPRSHLGNYLDRPPLGVAIMAIFVTFALVILINLAR
jgi:multicomponent Na+:H+ antiporter subunit D